ncbi:MAG: hypothetical protein ACRDJC_11795, partial [Thermomicrobiales bacterium]
MHRIVALVITLSVLAGLIGLAPPEFHALARAQEPAGELCSAEEIAAGETSIVEMPQGTGGIVIPEDAPDRLLYVVMVTLPPGTCVPYHAHDGALSLFVHEGTLEYAARTQGPGQVVIGDQAANRFEVASESPVLVETGSWVTQAAPVEYTYRNAGPDDAVVAIAAFVSFDSFEQQAAPESTPEADAVSEAAIAFAAPEAVAQFG